jgi:sulfate transport system ATP-binding protein
MGSVNIFHGRVQNGKATLGPLALDYPQHPAAEVRAAAGYARPHELEVEREGGSGAGFWAILDHVNAAGVLVKLELTDEERRPFHVQMTRERYQELRPQVGERLYVRPRRIQVFVEEQT